MGWEFEGEALRARIEELERELARRKQAEVELMRDRALLHAAITNLPFDFFALDKTGRYILQNPSFQRAYGNLLGRRPEDADADPSLKKLWIENNRRALQGEVVSGEVEIPGAQGKRFYYNVLAPVHMDGEIAGIQGVNIDITRLKQTEEKLREVRDELEARVAQRTEELRRVVQQLEQEVAKHKQTTRALERANQQLRVRAHQSEEARRTAEETASAKSSLLANMSHEIRTPMTAILGFAELLQELQERWVEAAPLAGGEAVVQEGRRHVSMIRTCGAQLLNLINDILDISKIEQRGMRLDQSVVSVVEVVHEVIDVMRATAADKRLSLNVRYNGPVPQQLHTDRNALTRILMNLVGNALKFTDEGAVTVEVGFSKEEHLLHIRVVDTGIGIGDEDLARLFTPFYQASTSKTAAGTGLGLAISRELVRLLGGDLRVESELGHGSAFHFSLPCRREDAEVLIQPDKFLVRCRREAAALTGNELPYRILVAEDVETNRLLIERILGKAGAQVTMVKNGSAAVVEALTCYREGNPYHVILMDMVMPVTDGYEATRMLRQKGYDRPIIALTASAMGSDKMRCLQAGCDDYLTKPIDRAELVAVVQRRVEDSHDTRLAADM